MNGAAVEVINWAGRIRPHLTHAVESIFATGVELNAAKAALPHGQFGPLLDELGLSRQMANRFMQVASNPVLSNRSPVGGLPASVSVLDVLTRLDDDELTDAIERGAVTSSTTRVQALAIANPPPADQKCGLDRELDAFLALPGYPELLQMFTAARFLLLHGIIPPEPPLWSRYWPEPWASEVTRTTTEYVTWETTVGIAGIDLLDESHLESHWADVDWNYDALRDWMGDDSTDETLRYAGFGHWFCWASTEVSLAYPVKHAMASRA